MFHWTTSYIYDKFWTIKINNSPKYLVWKSLRMQRHHCPMTIPFPFKIPKDKIETKFCNGSKINLNMYYYKLYFLPYFKKYFQTQFTW